MSPALTDTTNSRIVRARQHALKLHMAADHSTDFSIDDRQPRGVTVPRETDSHKLEQRQKQIDYGKNTLGYAAYLRDVPRHRRKPEDPVTPEKTKGCSKRTFDGLIKKWRRELHRWDAGQGEGEAARPLAAELPPPPPGAPPAEAGPASRPARVPAAQEANGCDSTADVRGALHRSGTVSSGAGSKRRLDDSAGDGASASQPKLLRTSVEGGRGSTAPDSWADDDPADDLLPAACQEAAVDGEDIFGDWDDDDIQI